MAGTNKLKNHINGGPAIILIKPQLGENIGTAARAMYNFGLNDLRIVSPREKWPNKKANAASAGALEILGDNVKIYNNTKNIYAEGVLGPLFGRIEIQKNNKKKIIHHKIVYDYNLLKDVLTKSGFLDIKYFDPFDVFSEDYDDYSKSFIPYKDRSGLSMHLNIEAEKK